MKSRVAVFLALLMTVFFNHLALAADTLQDVKKRGVLIVGVRDDAPPFGFIDRNTGETVGVDVDLAAAVAKRLDVKLRLKTVSPAGWIPDLLSGKVDLVAATVSSNPDREKLVDFSLPYYNTTQRVLAKKGTISALQDLEGKKIGTGKGSAAERDIQKQVPSAVCYFFQDSRKAVEALQKGEVDALSASGTNLYGCLSNLPKGEYEIAEAISLSEEQFRLAVRKGNTPFLDQVNATLTELNENGGARKIFAKWFEGKGSETVPTAAAGAVHAAGIVTRVTSTQGRYLVLPISGIFRPSTDVSISDPAGNPVGMGKVTSIYEEETYIDAIDAEKGLIRAGFVVSMNLGNDAVKKIIADNKEVIEKVRTDAKAEEERVIREAGAEFQQAKKERERTQEEMAKTRLNLEYQFSDQYYGYYGYPFR